MQKAYFDSIGVEIRNILKSAKQTVHIAMAWFTNDDMFQAIIDCMERGVYVELILLDDVINWNPHAPDFEKIINHKNGILRIAKSNIGFMHHKFCIVDSHTTITGSYNWTWSAESNNLENILVSTDPIVTEQFEKEFQRLKSNLSIADRCIRLTRDDIEQREHVDYETLNYEIKKSVEKRRVTEFPVFKTHTSVKVIEKHYNPVSSYDIGVWATEGTDTDVMGVIIPRGISLPATCSFDFITYADERDTVCCNLLYGTSSKASENSSLKTKPLREITEGSSREQYKIKIEIYLAPNGYLLADISCEETKKAIELTTTNSNLVKYEE